MVHILLTQQNFGQTSHHVKQTTYIEPNHILLLFFQTMISKYSLLPRTPQKDTKDLYDQRNTIKLM